MTVQEAAAGRRLADVKPGAESPEKTREIRIGLVMYGGVSLAIYINGVAREFFRAVHGNGVYKLLKRLADADIVVDVISGTSAGGINGIFLGYALTNGKDFAGMAQLWREHGDIGRLLHDPAKLPDPTNSALNSEVYYHERLREAFAQLPDYATRPDDEPSSLNELDLFVPSTKIDGEVYTTFDDAGHPVDVKDHRAVFLLKHRARRRHEFDNDAATHEALARLSRATSAFSGAFQSVPVHDAQWNGGGRPQLAAADEKLRTWGNLNPKKTTWFIDGGVLDNKPFSYTTREIAHRTTDRKIERYLFYVEPDPEQFAKDAKARAESPTFLDTIVGGALSIPSYESIATDLQLISDTNTKLQQYDFIASAVTKATVAGGGVTLGAAASALYHKGRLLQVSRRAIRGMVGEREDDMLPSQSPDAKLKRDVASRLLQSFDELVTRRAGNEDGALTLLDFDVYYRERILDHIGNYLYDNLHAARTSDTAAHNGAVGGLLHRINRMRKFVEILRFHMEGLADDYEIEYRQYADAAGKLDPRKLDEGALGEWQAMQSRFRALLDASAYLALIPERYEARQADVFEQPHLTAIYAALQSRRNDAARVKVDGTAFRSLLRVCDEHLASLVQTYPNLPADVATGVRAIHDHFENVDALLFPLQLLSGVGEDAVIRTVRISPVDAQRAFSRRSLASKVAGDDLAHFSGFLKSSWRSNDILWGRLDACAQILECILSAERLETLFGDAAKRAEMRKLLTDGGGSIAALVDGAFPHAAAASRGRIADWISALSGDDDAGARTARQGAMLSDSVELLIGLAQLEILHESLPDVAEDQQKLAASWKVTPPESSLWEKQTAPGPYPIPAGCESERAIEFSHYDVGKETFHTNLPRIVLVDTIFRTLFVVKAALISSIPSEKLRKRLRRSLLLFFFVTLPLKTGHRLAKWRAGKKLKPVKTP